MHGPGLHVKFQFEEMDEYLKSLAGAVAEGVLLLLLVTRILRTGNATLKGLKKLGVPPIVMRCYLVASAIFGFVAAGFVISSILGDATYRLMAGNEGPNREQIIAGYANARQQVLAQFQHGPAAAAYGFGFAVISFASSISIYLYPWVKKNALTSLCLPPKQTFWRIYSMGLLVSLLSVEGWYSPVMFSFLSIIFDPCVGSIIVDGKVVIREAEQIHGSLVSCSGKPQCYFHST
mmetsp:Transcript_16211/g.35037  ORF Transcript_16211/g.35037 Transcript_16211/m.35037 type:complete len:234 (-) Transcript_16211:407-1108(-)